MTITNSSSSPSPTEHDPLLQRNVVQVRKHAVNCQKFHHFVAVLAATIGILALLALGNLSSRNGYQSAPPTSPLFAAKLPIPVQPPTLLAVGDWGRDGIEPQRKVASSMAIAASHDDVTVLSTGDNFYDYGVKTPHDISWNSSYEGVYSAQPQLANAPFLPVLGNHDHLGDALAQVEYTKHSKNWHLPARFNAELIAQRVLLVRIDTTPFLTDKSGRAARRRGFRPDPQVSWFKQVMAEADRLQMYVIVMGHHNMYSASSCGNKKTKHIRKHIEATLVKHRKRLLAYVCGHEHALEHVKAKGIDHFISGGGSLLDKLCLPKPGEKVKHAKRIGFRRGNDAPFVKAANGFFKFRFDVKSARFEAQAIDQNNRVLYTFEKTVPS